MPIDLENITIENNKKNKPVDAVLDVFAEKCLIDTSKEISKPPTILSIVEKGAMRFENLRLFTLGNFSAITGKAKSKKSFLQSMFTSTVMSKGLLFNLSASPKETTTLLFDTEQSDYDAQRLVRRIEKLAGTNSNFYAYGLRGCNPGERKDIIEYVIKEKENVGFVMIDGIADLSYTINDEEEASEVVSWLLKLTKDYNCHICNIIHQNKGNDYATGWLGSQIMKKAEIVIKVEENRVNKRASNVECDMIRGERAFNTFSFEINGEGLPEIKEGKALTNKETINNFL